MGMPSMVYRFFFRAHSLKSMKRNILQFVGIKPVSDTVIGMVGDMGEDKARRWRQRMDKLGRSTA